MKATHKAWQDVKLEQLSPTIARRYVHGDQAMVAKLELKAGAVVPWHEHPNEQISLIQSGRLRFEFGPRVAEQVIEVGAGETVVIPGGLPHQVTILEDAVAFDVFAPPREDWIRGDDAYLRQG